MNDATCLKSLLDARWIYFKEEAQEDEYSEYKVSFLSPLAEISLEPSIKRKWIYLSFLLPSASFPSARTISEAALGAASPFLCMAKGRSFRTPMGK